MSNISYFINDIFLFLWKEIISFTLACSIILIFKDLEANFIKRAEGDVHYICKESKAIAAAVEQTINTGERVNIAVPVIATVPDSFGDEPVATFTITLSMKEK